MRWLLGLLVFLVGMQVAAQVAANDYVGAKTCQTCHAEVYTTWQKSDHFQSMRLPDADSVLGDFNHVTVEFHGVESRFTQKNDGYYINTASEVGEEEFKIAYTFGHRPLQQYLVALAGGHVQALNVAWDSRPKEEGGQRWYHLREDASSDQPFFWKRHFQNWNSRCADCHSTNLQKNYDPGSKQFTTTFSDVNVACEACHGPASEHVRTANAGAAPSPLLRADQTLTWRYQADMKIAQSTGSATDATIDMCGGCHSRRNVIGEISPGKHYADQYQLSLLDAGLYHADGQIDDEVFVLGSFMQSKMHAKGVTCMNCHEPHSGELLLVGNGLCAQCHNPANYNVTAHLMHEPEQPGSACVDCHMPEKTYMGVDDRRDHRFGIPNPGLTELLGIPNACNTCHSDQSAKWAKDKITQPVPPDEFAMLHQALRQDDPMRVTKALSYIYKVDNPAIKRATLLANLPLTEFTVRASMELLRSENELVRAAAVVQLAGAPAVVRQKALEPAASDETLLVRSEVGRNLSELLPEVPSKDLARYLGYVSSYRTSLALNLETPGGQSDLGLLEQRLGKINSAKQAYQTALDIEPHYIPAALNLADLERAQGNEIESLRLLKAATQVASDSAAANHSYGLALVRNKDVEQAVRYFKLATEQDDSTARYAYVYSIALDSIGRGEESVAVLKQASVNWSNQYDLLILEVLYREKLQDVEGVIAPLEKLKRIAPDSEPVRMRLQRYGIN